MAGLALSRKVGEQILIDGDIVITVVESAKGRCRLTVQAPAGTRVLRMELTNSPSAKGASCAAGSGSLSVSGS
jgi:carbon storage regulator CsrA